MGILSLLLLLPLVVAAVSAAVPPASRGLLRGLHLGATLLQLALVLVLVLPAVYALPTASTGNSALPTALALAEVLPWLRLELGGLGTLVIDYRLGVDGLSVWLVVLHSLLMPIAVGASWHVTRSPKAYFALLQLLNTAVLGSFLALDLVLFYLFFEVMLLPMFFLIGIWGGKRRSYAAVKFFLYTLLGSVLMLIVVLGLPFSHALPSGVHSTSLAVLADGGTLQAGAYYTSEHARLIGFLLLLGAFAIKLPAVPLHTWLPDAHVEASTPISVLLAGILLKAGGYGLIRVGYGLFPQAGEALAFWVVLLGVVGIVYGSLAALAQSDLKRLVAYSSVAHMGYVLLGLGSCTAAGWNGAVLQLFTHGLVTAMLFLLVGVIYERVGSRTISDFAGLWQRMPRYGVLVAIAFFAGLALPGTATFISELLALMGGFAGAAAGRYSYVLAGLALLGVVLSAGYFLWAFQRMFFGDYHTAGGEGWTAKLTDLTLREHLLLWPLALLVVGFGVWPQAMAELPGRYVQAFFEGLATPLTTPVP